MSNFEGLDVDVVPDDAGETAAHARARATLETVRASSPRHLYGADTLREIVGQLNSRRSKGLPEITVWKLAMKLRPYCRFASHFQKAAKYPATSDLYGELWEADDPVQSQGDTTASDTDEPPSAETRGDAKKTIEQAKRALAKLHRLVTSREVRAYASFDTELLTQVEAELVRVKEAIKPPWGEQHRPELAMTIDDLKSTLIYLCGSSLRGPNGHSDADTEDQFLKEIMFRLARPICWTGYSKQEIEGAINTSVKKPLTSDQRKFIVSVR